MARSRSAGPAAVPFRIRRGLEQAELGGRALSGPATGEPRPLPPVDVVIPALDEERSIGAVVSALPRCGVREVVVVDNGSSDRTAERARAAGATVIREPRRGYGSACLAGIAHVARSDPPPGVVVFLDGDLSDHPEELPQVAGPVLRDEADLVVGSRVLGRRERGALLPQARAGNWVAARLMRWIYGVAMTDLGPFRAIRWTSLSGLDMRDRDFGWTAEMQAKAARDGLRYLEVPVRYRRRVGRSKISGTLGGSARAGWKILRTLIRCRPRRPSAGR